MPPLLFLEPRNLICQGGCTGAGTRGLPETASDNCYSIGLHANHLLCPSFLYACNCTCTLFILHTNISSCPFSLPVGHPLTLSQEDIGIKGWAVEARVYAEVGVATYG